MKYLLDTDAFSDIVRGNVNVESRFSLVLPALVRISSVTVNEVEYGRRLSPERVTRRSAMIDSLLRKIAPVSFDAEAAFLTGRLRASLKRAGTPIGPYDVMIAATAVVHGLILVTANTREFSRISELQLENWRLPLSEVRDTLREYRVLSGHGEHCASSAGHRLCRVS